jgi:Na+/H+ antiporter NhaD/arsenite permease-like protein
MVTEMPGLLDQFAGRILAMGIGAIYVGAATCLVEGPNFMVTSVAAQQGLAMPFFFKFIVKFTLPFLVPVRLSYGGFSSAVDLRANI